MHNCQSADFYKVIFGFFKGLPIFGRGVLFVPFYTVTFNQLGNIILNIQISFDYADLHTTSMQIC